MPPPVCSMRTQPGRGRASLSARVVHVVVLTTCTCVAPCRVCVHAYVIRLWPRTRCLQLKRSNASRPAAHQTVPTHCSEHGPVASNALVRATRPLANTRRIPMRSALASTVHLHHRHNFLYYKCFVIHYTQNSKRFGKTASDVDVVGVIAEPAIRGDHGPRPPAQGPGQPGAACGPVEVDVGKASVG